MALTDQPYLTFFVDDWMNNNKLKTSSMNAHGLMISIMCVMHKENPYGKLLLKQKYNQTESKTGNFALQLAKLTAFDSLEILPVLNELIEAEILVFEDNFLVCPRMVRDNEISKKRSEAGRIGGKSTQTKYKKEGKNFALAKSEANTVNGNEYGNDNEIKEKGGTGEKTEPGEKEPSFINFTIPEKLEVEEAFFKYYRGRYPDAAIKKVSDKFYRNYLAQEWKKGNSLIYNFRYLIPDWEPTVTPVQTGNKKEELKWN